MSESIWLLWAREYTADFSVGMTHDTQAVERGSEPSDPRQARRELRDRAEEVKREQLNEALERLQAEGQINAAQRRILEEMSTAIVDEILPGPEATLFAEGECSQERIAAVVELFDCGECQRS